MCYPCTHCGLCGKYREDSPYYVPPAPIPCLACGGDVDPKSGVCALCGRVAFAPCGTSSAARSASSASCAAGKRGDRGGEGRAEA